MVQSKTNDTNLPTNGQKPPILWLASWYPSKIDPLLGDFIQRQAHAAALLNKIVVWTIIDDPEGRVTRSQKIEVFNTHNLEENILYIFTGTWGNKPGYKYWKVLKILYHGWKALSVYYQNRQAPLAIHTHIAMYLGLLGHNLAKKIGVPHIISEQWTAYLPEAIPNISGFNPWSRSKLRNIFTGASAITAVSEYLLGFLMKIAPAKLNVRIPNVVDGNLFKPGNKSASTVFLCISADSYQKNLLDVLKAARLLKQKPDNPHFVLQIIHHPDPALLQQVNDLGIASHVQLLNPGSHKMVADYMSSASALILYSRYETFGCVVIEAQCCGLPVLAADIPVLRELVSHGTNGLLVKPESPPHLATAMLSVIENRAFFNPAEIRNTVLEYYSYQQVSKQYQMLYQDLQII